MEASNAPDIQISARLSAALAKDDSVEPRVTDVAKQLKTHYAANKSILDRALHMLGEQQPSPFYVVGSFQGAFSPPTRGHFEAMILAINEYVTTFPGKPIRLFFMPGAHSSSKAHVAMTVDERFAMLDIMCAVLNHYCNTTHPGVDIEISTSRIEHVLAESYKAEGKTIDTTTVNTFLMMHLLYPEADNITVVLGYDNLLGITTWKLFSYYADLVTHVFVPRRPASAEEETKKGVTIAALTAGAVQYIELGQPSATSSSMLRCVFRKGGDPAAITTLTGFDYSKRTDMSAPLNSYMGKVVPTLTDADCAKPDAIFPSATLPGMLPEHPVVTAYYASIGQAGGRRKFKKRTQRKSKKSKKSKKNKRSSK
jgi:nicotinic acid mononucleotide adenylyltransferase